VRHQGRAAIRWVVPFLVMTCLARSEDDAAAERKELTPEQRREIAARLEEADRLVRKSRAVQDQIGSLPALMASTLTERFPPPKELAPPARPTIEFAMPRGLAWLAAYQEVD